MSTRKLGDLLLSSIPSDMDEAELGMDSLSGDKTTIKSALAKCQRLNWGAYLANYPDVKASGHDPLDHFLNHGIYEGRKLTSWHPFRTNEIELGPKVSVIISNYNNELFLPKCLESLLSQTLKDIEIIAVDDASKDGSLRLLESYVARDKRVKILALPYNQSLHMTRMAAVPKALGEYVMFVDSDDFYEPNACETAYNEIIKGWDVVAFNLKFINHSTESEAAVTNWEKWYNGLPEGLYTGERLYNLAFEDCALPCLMWSKIYERQFLQGCFAMMEPGYHNLYEDLYEFLVISRHARHIRKIGARLVNYSFGTGITTGGQAEESVKEPAAHSAIFSPIKHFCASRQIGEKVDYVRSFLFKSSLKYVEKLKPEAVASYFRDLSVSYEPLYAATHLMREYFYRMEELAAKFQYLQSLREFQEGKMAFFDWGNVDDEIESAIKIARRHFSAFGEIALIGMNPPKSGKTHIRLLNKPGDQRQTQAHLTALYRLLKKECPSSLVFLDAYDLAIFWDIILLRFLNIRIGIIYQRDIITEMQNQRQRHKKLLACLRCVDRIICLDEFSKTYLEAMNIGGGMSSPEREEQSFSAAYANMIRIFTEKSERNFHSYLVAT